MIRKSDKKRCNRRSASVVAGIAVLVAAACVPAARDSDPLRESNQTTIEDSTLSDPDRALVDAASAGDAAAARAAIDAGADVNVRDDEERPVLLSATRARDIELATMLLDAGADPNAQDAIKDSAFLYAGAEGLDDIVTAALEHGADVTSTNRYGGTALIPASERGHVSTVKLLLDAGVPVNHVNNLSWTALHEAIILGDGNTNHIEIVRLLIEGGADVTIPDGDGMSPRDLAADRGYTEIVELIEAAD